MLVVVNGPIAAGKSAVARALVEELRRRGKSAVVLGLDEVVEMLQENPSLEPSSIWTEARRIHSKVANAFLSSPLDAVIVEGPFFDAAERSRLLEHVSSVPQVLWVTLRVSCTEALRRAREDGNRRISRNAAFLRRAHDDFAERDRTLDAADVVLDTETASPAVVARDIAGRLFT